MASVPPKRGLWQRITGVVRRLFNPPGQPPPPPPPPPPSPVERPSFEPTPSPPPFGGYAYEEAPSSQARSREEIEAELAEYRAHAYDNIGEDLAIDDDEFAMGLLYNGWFDMDIEPEGRRAAREQFFDYLGLDDYEFPWDDWREWYGKAA